MVMTMKRILWPYMLNKGIKTYYELADLCGFKHWYIYKICERAGKIHRKDVAEKLADVLEIPLDVIYEQPLKERAILQKEPEDFEVSDQLCWWCVNSVPEHGRGCSWSKWLVPVEGWTAERSLKTTLPYETWRVIRCPEFVREKEKR